MNKLVFLIFLGTLVGLAVSSSETPKAPVRPSTVTVTVYGKPTTTTQVIRVTSTKFATPPVTTTRTATITVKKTITVTPSPILKTSTKYV